MAIRDWSVRTIQWLWIGLLSGYALLFLPGIARTRVEEQAARQVAEAQQRRDDSVRQAMSPAQRARADSLRDSARALLRSAGNTALTSLSTPKAKEVFRDVATGLLWTSTIVFAALLAPIVVVIAITTRWWKARKRLAAGNGV